MTDDEREAALFARMDAWGADLNFGLHDDMLFLRRRILDMRAAHDARVGELLEALKVTRQALLEVGHARDVGPEWFTKGQSAHLAHIRHWFEKGCKAAAAALGEAHT